MKLNFVETQDMRKLALHVLVAGILLVRLECLKNSNGVILNTAVFLEEDSVDRNSVHITQVAIRDAIRIIAAKTKYEIHYEALKLGTDQVFEAGKEVCHWVQYKLAAIFGPESPEINGVIQSVASSLRIPQFQTIPNLKQSLPFTQGTSQEQGASIFNLYPNTKLISQALATLVSHWRSYTIIYENDDGFFRIQESLKRKHVNSAVTFRKLGYGPDNRWVLKQIKHSEEVNFILDCKASRIFQVLRDAKAVNLMEEYHNYILTDLDAHTLDWSEFANIRTNLTVIRLLDPQSHVVRNAVKAWAVKPELIKGWSLFSSSATKIASKATENAVKYGGIASQKVVDISSQVGEKVKDGTLVEGVTTQVSTLANKAAELGRKGWNELSGTNSPSNYHSSGGYGEVDGQNYHSPGEKSSLFGSGGNGYSSREEDWSVGSQQGSKASSPKSPSQSWGYQNATTTPTGGYQSEYIDFIGSDSAVTSPVENTVKSKKEKKVKEQKKNTCADKWGDDELWESLNK